jgi:hypothetical protein
MNTKNQGAGTSSPINVAPLTIMLNLGSKASNSLFLLSDTTIIWRWLYQFCLYRRLLGNGGCRDDQTRTYASRHPTVGMTGKPESAGINRHVVGDARALQERK